MASAGEAALNTALEVNTYIERNPDQGCTWYGQVIPRCVDCPFDHCPREAMGLRALPAHLPPPARGKFGK